MPAPAPVSARGWLRSLGTRGLRRVGSVWPALDRVSRAVDVLAVLAAGLVGSYVWRLADSGSAEHLSAHRSPALTYALSLTVLFLLAGPFVIGYGKLLAAQLYGPGSPPPVAGWLTRRHFWLVSGIWGPASALALLSQGRLAAAVWPMPATFDVVAFFVGVAVVVLLCSEGIFQACFFLALAWAFVHSRGDDRTLVERCVDEPETEAFDHTHAYATWGFAGVGALQAPIMLVVLPHLPTASAFAAAGFIVALVGIGPLLYQLPRYWQRHALESELDARLSRALGRSVAPGPDEEALVRIYEHVLSRLRGRGVALTVPSLALAGLLKADEVRKAVEALAGVAP